MMQCPDPTSAQLDIVVLLGGDSSERHISLASGNCVASALRSCGHVVRKVDPAESDLYDLDWNCIDACFIAIHGGAGEDGRIQNQLQQMDVPYTGSGPDASRLAMSKSLTKNRLNFSDVPTPVGVCLDFDSDLETIARHVNAIGYPLVIKPDSQGCSLGVAIAQNSADLGKCIEQARRYESRGVAEAFLYGREFTVTLIGRRPLPVLEIASSNRMFDYDSKFGSAQCTFRFPLEEDVHEVTRTALAAADALGTDGLVRVDILLDRSEQPCVLEANTIPGMTERSLAPMAARKAGIGMPKLCDQLIRACLASAAPTMSVHKKMVIE